MKQKHKPTFRLFFALWGTLVFAACTQLKSRLGGDTPLSNEHLETQTRNNEPTEDIENDLISLKRILEKDKPLHTKENRDLAWGHTLKIARSKSKEIKQEAYRLWATYDITRGQLYEAIKCKITRDQFHEEIKCQATIDQLYEAIRCQAKENNKRLLELWEAQALQELQATKEYAKLKKHSEGHICYKSLVPRDFLINQITLYKQEPRKLSRETTLAYKNFLKTRGLHKFRAIHGYREEGKVIQPSELRKILNTADKNSELAKKARKQLNILRQFRQLKQLRWLTKLGSFAKDAKNALNVEEEIKVRARKKVRIHLPN